MISLFSKTVGALQGLCLLLMITAPVQAATLKPSHPSMPGRSVSLSKHVVDLTLSDAIYLGLRNNRTIRSAYLGRIAQKFDLQVSEDSYDPKLVLSARYLNERNQDDRYQEGEIIPQTTWATEYGTRISLAWANQMTLANQAGRSRSDGIDLSVTQPLLRGAGHDIATAPLKLAHLNERINRLNLQATVSDTITQIITTYREMLRAKEQLRIAREALKRSRRLLQVNQALIEAGRMAEFEIVQTEADIASQELSVEEAANQLDDRRLSLLQLLSLDLDTPIRAADDLDASLTHIDLAQALAVARTHQPAYLIQQLASERADINLAVARNESLWDVSLIGGLSQVRNRYASSKERTWASYVGVQVDIPVGDPGQRQAEVNAHVEVEQQKLHMDDTRQSLKRDVANAVRNLETRWRQYEIAQRGQELSRRALEIEREKLQAGRSSNFQVLSFESDLRNAENARLDAMLAYLNAQTALDQVLGTTLASWDIELNDRTP